MHVQEITRLYSCVESEADEDAKWQPPMEKHFSAYYKGRIRQKKKSVYFVRIRNCQGQQCMYVIEHTGPSGST